MKLLQDYEHLVEKDEVDCQKGTKNFGEAVSCFNRKYTASIVSLFLIGIISALIYRK